jgi:hypothetical protein
MPIVVGVATNAWRAKLPNIFGGLVAFSPATYFKVGFGGWINPGSGPVPRMPDPTLTDLDVIINPSHYPTIPPKPFFQKTLLPGQFLYETPTTLRINCLLDFGDYNDDGTGGSPQIWEIGVFDGANVMMAYGTFAQEIKNNSKQIENDVRIIF